MAATKRNPPTKTQSKAQPRSNAQRQADYRQRHLKSEEHNLQRLGLMVDLHAKLALQRLANCYGVTQRSMLESLILQAQRVAVDEAIAMSPTGHADYYDGRLRLQREPVMQ
jgi:hypothetical protein